jgi:type IV secretion system protein VirB1
MSGILSVAAALALAQQCASGVAPETVVSIARAESGLNPLAIHDNTSGRSYVPESANEATALATSLIHSQRHSVDIGLMQVNSANLAISKLSIAEAFNACHSIEAGAHILAGAFRRALRSALSAYNSGDPQRGINNGYVARVEAAAVRVPAIAPVPAPAPSVLATQPGALTAAGWDVFAPSGGTQFVFTSNGATANAR